MSVLKTVFKKDGSLDFDIDKTNVLGKYTTVQHVFGLNIYSSHNVQ